MTLYQSSYFFKLHCHKYKLIVSVIKIVSSNFISPHIIEKFFLNIKLHCQLRAHLLLFFFPIYLLKLRAHLCHPHLSDIACTVADSSYRQIWSQCYNAVYFISERPSLERFQYRLRAGRCVEPDLVEPSDLGLIWDLI